MEKSSSRPITTPAPSPPPVASWSCPSSCSFARSPSIKHVAVLPCLLAALSRLPPSCRDGKYVVNEEGRKVTKEDVIIDAVERGFTLSGHDYSPLYLWDDASLQSDDGPWKSLTSKERRSLSSRFSATLAVYWALTHSDMVDVVASRKRVLGARGLLGGDAALATFTTHRSSPTIHLYRFPSPAPPKHGALGQQPPACARKCLWGFLISSDELGLRKPHVKYEPASTLTR